MKGSSQSAYQRALAVVLASLMSVLPLLAQSPGTPAAQVTAVIPSADRNQKPVKLKEEVAWNDLLRTDRSGRARLSLRDGSILSMGSNSELKLIQHDPASQQTVLQLNFGKVRSRVVAINLPGGRFEVHTPLAVVNVLGTDFFTQFDAPSNTVRVICYSGTVRVAGVGKFEGKSETIHAGQMLQIGASSGFGSPQATLNAVQQDSIAETTSEGSGVNVANDSHFVRNVLIGAAAVAAGVVVGLAVQGSSAAATSSAPTRTSPASAGQKKPPAPQQ